MFSFMEDIKTFRAHVVTKDFTQLVLNELDTISDFVEYLRKKETFLSGDKRLTILGGEEELLAFYLVNGRSFERLEKADVIMIHDGSWDHLQKKPEYRAKKEADKISYYWDSIIDRAHTGGREYEHIARELARPNRVWRRFLSKSFFDAQMKAHNDDRSGMYRRKILTQDATYCFLFADEPEPRERRRDILATMCFIARGQHPEHKKVVGIATEKKIRPTCSYDFCLLDIPEWTEKQQRDMERLQKNTGIFVNPFISRADEDEYPKIKER